MLGKIGVAVAVIIMVLPFVLMVSGSLQSIVGIGSLVGSVMRVIPRSVTFQNYIDLAATEMFPMMILNSAIAVLGYSLPSILVCGLLAYALAYFDFKAKKAVFLAAMATVFVPASILLIPRYMAMKVLGLTGMPAVLVVGVFWAPGIFMMRGYFESIPASLRESAKIDGAGDWAIFRRVVLPLSRPLVGAACVFQGISALGDYLWQMLNLTRPWQMTMLVGLYRSVYDRMSRQGRNMQSNILFNDFGYGLAIAVVVMLPSFIIFAVASKYFIGELTTGGVKE